MGHQALYVFPNWNEDAHGLLTERAVYKALVQAEKDKTRLQDVLGVFMGTRKTQRGRVEIP